MEIPSPNPGSPRPKRVLLVEDERDLHPLVAYHLAKRGIETVSAYDGETGLSLYQNQHFDLLLLDLMLPMVSGLEICRKLRYSGARVPIILLMAVSRDLAGSLTRDLEIRQLLHKPFDPRKLLAAVEEVLPDHQAA